MKKIGIDLGGTGIKSGLFAEDGTLLARNVQRTPAREGRAALFGALYAAIDAFEADDVDLIGISSAGDIDPYAGKVVYATNNLIGWSGADIFGALKKRYPGVRLLADNDAVCALKAELRFHPGCKNVTMLTFGTGVGGASLVEGSIVRGARFDAARWGHVILVPGGTKCNCGRRGCAEAYLSATALLKSGRRRIYPLADCKELFTRYAAGDPNADDVLSLFGERLNVLLTNIRTALAPECIILGGGLMQSEDVVRKLLDDDSDIAFARLGGFAGVYGAITEGIL